MHLPDAADAYVAPEKVTGYLLNPDHPDGGPKAKFFRMFGFDAGQAEILISALREHPLRHEVVAEEPTAYGVKHLVRCSLESPDGRNPCVQTVWIREAGEVRSRLVTAYPSE